MPAQILSGQINCNFGHTHTLFEAKLMGCQNFQGQPTYTKSGFPSEVLWPTWEALVRTSRTQLHATMHGLSLGMIFQTQMWGHHGPAQEILLRISRNYQHTPHQVMECLLATLCLDHLAHFLYIVGGFIRAGCTSCLDQPGFTFVRPVTKTLHGNLPFCWSYLLQVACCQGQPTYTKSVWNFIGNL